MIDDITSKCVDSLIGYPTSTGLKEDKDESLLTQLNSKTYDINGTLGELRTEISDCLSNKKPKRKGRPKGIKGGLDRQLVAYKAEVMLDDYAKSPETSVITAIPHPIRVQLKSDIGKLEEEAKSLESQAQELRKRIVTIERFLSVMADE